MSKGTVPITGTITTTSELDTYPTHWDKYAKGGHRSVIDTIERNAITLERRTEGMQVYVRDIKTLYQLIGGIDNTKWVTLLSIDANNKVIINLDPSSINLNSGKLLIGDITNKAVETQTLKISNLPADFATSGVVKFDSTSSTLKIAVSGVDYATSAELKALAEAAAKSANDASADAGGAAKSASLAGGAASEATGAAVFAKGYKEAADKYAEAAGKSATEAFGAAGLATGFADASNSYANDSSDYADTSKAASKVAGERRDAAEAAATSAQNSLDKLLKTGLNEFPNNGDIDIKGFKIINAANATNASDLVTLSQVSAISGIATITTKIASQGGLALNIEGSNAEIYLPLTGVFPGTYTCMNATVDSWGRILSASSATVVSNINGTTDRITVTGFTTPTINIASTYEGQISINTLGTINTGTWNGSIIPLAFGGTNSKLIPSNGGIVYSTATALSILAAPATANMLLVSVVGAAPKWSSRYVDYGATDVNNKGNLFVGTECGPLSLASGIVGNTGFGISALSDTTGSYNSAFGNNTLSTNTSGAQNSAFGASALLYNTTGSYNNAFGTTALALNTTGLNNSAFGDMALESNTTGSQNCAFGSTALARNTTGSYNSAFGMHCLDAILSGSENAAFGAHAGEEYTVYNKCTFLGVLADASVSGLTNASAVGYFARVSKSNCMVLGGSGAFQLSVGIGITPNAQLQLPTAHSPRKIVLSETANNDHQVYGLGTAAGIFKFQIDNITSSYTFNAATGTEASNELMRITGKGYVGIGTTTPNAPLQFANSFSRRVLVLSQNDNNDHQFHGFGTTGSILRYQVPDTGGSHIFSAGVSASSSIELMRISVDYFTNNAYVGIGTNAPHAPLQFSQDFSTNKKIVLYEQANNEHEFYGMGINAGIFRFQIPTTTTTSNFVFFAGNSGGGGSPYSNELMRLTGAGRLGIGTNAPDMPLSVNGNASKSGGGSWAALSDKRIKTVKGSYKQGLAEILKVRPIRFKYNDKSGYAEEEQAKLRVGIVAQEIEDIFPECIVDKVQMGDILDVRVYEDTALTYALINAVKELSAKIDHLETRLQAYEK